jgi:3-oxoadipate enol-lactonase
MKIDLHNTHLNVEDHGRGLPLLLIHGFPLSLEIWRPQIDTLSISARVIAPDLRGHGQSPPTSGPYTMDMLADDCAAVLQALKIDRPIVVCGLSMGGYVTFAFYRRHPSLVAGLILASTRAGADTPEAKVMRDKSAVKAEKEGIQAVTNNMLPKIMAPRTYTNNPELVTCVEEIMAQTSLDGMVAALKGMKLRPDSTATLAELDVPVLILHGSEDQIIPLQEAENMQRAITGSQLEIIPETGHLPNLEQPQIFNQAILDFLPKVTP